MEEGKQSRANMYIEDGIFYIIHAQGTVIDLADAKDGVAKRLEICKGKKYPLFVDGRGIKKFDKQARAYLAGPDGIKGVSAGAFLINSRIKELLANAWFSLNKPAVPTKLFTKKEDAIKWLENYKVYRMN